MEIEIRNNQTGEVTPITCDDFPVYTHNGSVIDKLPHWLQVILPFEKMQYRNTDKGKKLNVAYKQINKYVIFYDVKESD